ncbi:hypothetical protein STEG23_026934 [Scotinomys teguina]
MKRRCRVTGDSHKYHIGIAFNNTHKILMVLGTTYLLHSSSFARSTPPFIFRKDQTSQGYQRKAVQQVTIGLGTHPNNIEAG